MVWASAPAIPPIYALQVALDWDDDFSNVVGSRMREVAFLMDGAKIGQIPGDNNGWKTLGQTSGEVWVNCIVNKEGAFVSAGVSTQQGPIDIYPPLTAKDYGDLDLGVELGVDYFALSFAREPGHVQHLQLLLEQKKSKARVIAKTEHRSLTAHVNLLIEEDLRKRQRKTRKP